MGGSNEPRTGEWANAPGEIAACVVEGTVRERRSHGDRRHRVWWSVLYGSFNPRRRRPPRRIDDARFHTLDWHRAQLLAVAIGILTLNVVDAFLTVTLLAAGAIEINPVLAMIFEHRPALFVGLKMASTGASILVLVALAYHRFMRIIKVEIILYVILIAYILLIAHELQMLRGITSVNAP